MQNILQFNIVLTMPPPLLHVERVVYWTVSNYESGNTYVILFCYKIQYIFSSECNNSIYATNNVGIY